MNLPRPVLSFLHEHWIATIATISQEDDYPHVVPIFYIAKENGTIYFLSNVNSKKLENILSHPHIGMVITNSDTLTSLELKGDATVVSAAAEKLQLVQEINTVATKASSNAFPPVLQLNDGSSIQVIKFSIEWYRLSSYGGKEPEFTEGTLSPSTTPS
jgi:nitroimidazol reductase NimA-like FMN-containing flavoprotein (pyridoxamine 5'-phosphate oxidase superfamily)